MSKKPGWVRVKAPTFWAPDPDEEIVGVYRGRTLRQGSFGPYEVILVKCGDGKSYIVSGVNVIQAIDAGQIDKGDTIKIAFRGVKKLCGDRSMKMFEVYVQR